MINLGEKHAVSPVAKKRKRSGSLRTSSNINSPAVRSMTLPPPLLVDNETSRRAVGGRGNVIKPPDRTGYSGASTPAESSGYIPPADVNTMTKTTVGRRSVEGGERVYTCLA